MVRTRQQMARKLTGEKAPTEAALAKQDPVMQVKQDTKLDKDALLMNVFKDLNLSEDEKMLFYPRLILVLELIEKLRFIRDEKIKACKSADEKAPNMQLEQEYAELKKYIYNELVNFFGKIIVSEDDANFFFPRLILVWEVIEKILGLNDMNKKKIA